MNLNERLVELVGRTMVEGPREADVVVMARALLYVNTQLNIMANHFDECEGLREHKNAVQRNLADFFASDKAPNDITGDRT